MSFLRSAPLAQFFISVQPGPGYDEDEHVSTPRSRAFRSPVIGLFAGIGVEGAVAVLRATRLRESQRLIAVSAIVVIMALVAVLVILLGSGYWD